MNNVNSIAPEPEDLLKCEPECRFVREEDTRQNKLDLLLLLLLRAFAMSNDVDDQANTLQI